MVASLVTSGAHHPNRVDLIAMVFLLAASVRSLSWLCQTKASEAGSTRVGMLLTAILLGSPILSGCLAGDDWDESELDFQDYYDYEHYICYNGIAIWDCYDFPEDLEEKSSMSYRFGSYGINNGDLLKLTLSSHEDSSGMAVVTVTTQDKSDSFKLSSGDSESGIFEMSGSAPQLEIQLKADNGWFGDIVHYTIEVQIDTTFRDRDYDGYIDSEDHCASIHGNSSVSHLGCPDSDGDGWRDTTEIVCNTSSVLRNHTPRDLDGDGVCNYLDADVDGDGWDNAVELSCGADPFSLNSIPVVNSTGECHAILLDDGGFWESAKGLIAAMAIIGTLVILVMIFPNRPNATTGAPRRHGGAANGSSDYWEGDYEELTVAKLKVLLRQRGLPVSGKKAELIFRLLADDGAVDFEDGYFGHSQEDDSWFGVTEFDPAEEPVIGVFRKDVNHAVWVQAQIGQTIGDAVASSGLVGRDGTAWSIQDKSGSDVDKGAPATSFWSQNVSVVFQ